MKLIDMHCDTLWKLMDLDRGGDLMENRCSVSIPYMKKAGTKAQFFACFTYLPDYLPPDHASIDHHRAAGCGGSCFEDMVKLEEMKSVGYDRAFCHVQEMAAYLRGQVCQYPQELAQAFSCQELQKNAEDNRISAVLTVEEGGILNGCLERLEDLYAKGVRLMTLMWNYENCIGYPNSADEEIMGLGLKPFGIEVVQRMNELGMIVDVSHGSDGTFWDVLKYSGKPVVASHSNCRALCNHPRNLSDEMIRALADVGGIAGLNFYGKFLGASSESRIEEMAAHVLHMIQAGGEEFPAIGTDFDGFDGMERMDIPDVSQMERLWDALKKAGVSERQLDKIWGGNVERIMRDVL